MKITLQDFKKHERLSVDLDGNVCITGKNGEGKTAILEGIVFGLYGRNFYGGFGTDVFIRKGQSAATVVLEIGGIEIKRTQGKEHLAYVNGIESRVGEVTGLFPPLEVAMPVINPLYFLYEMSEIARRNLFMRYLPKRKREDVFKEMFPDRTDLVERFNTTTLEQVRKLIREVEKEISANTKQINEYKLEIERQQVQADELKKKIGKLPKGVLEEEIRLQEKLEEVNSKLIKMGNPVNKINTLNAQKKELEQQVKPVVEKLGVETTSKAIEKLKEHLERLEELIEEKTREELEIKIHNGNVEKMKGGICPLCKQKVDNSQYTLKSTQEVEKQLGELRAKKEKLEKLTDQLEGIIVKRVSIDQDIEWLSSQIKMFESLSKQKEKINSALKGNKEDFEKGLEAERNRARLAEIQLDIKRRKATISKLETSNKRMTESISDNLLLEKALGNKGVDSQIAIDQSLQLKELLSPYVDVVLQTVIPNKTNDNVRETFEIFTEEGVAFNSMSFGERLKISIAFGLVLRDLIKDFNIPFVLLDEASILSEENLDIIKGWLNEKGVSLIYTKADNNKLSISGDGGNNTPRTSKRA